MLTRRQFMGSSCAVAAASGAASLIGGASAKVSAGTPEYRALVCIALGGGADSFNMLVPTDAGSYANYTKRRGALALTHDELLPLHRGDREGRSYALHHGLSEVHELYTAGDIALVANVGSLQGPNGGFGTARMPDLSHADFIARWQHGSSSQGARSGWAGRVADLAADYGWQEQVPINISMSGRNVLQFGANTAATSLQSSQILQPSARPVGVDFSYVNEQLAERAITAGSARSLLRKARRLDKAENESRLIVQDAVADIPRFQPRFAPNSFSSDLQHVARVIAARSKLGARRQIFFVHFDGWDHHHSLLENHARMLPMLSRGLADFRSALIADNVLNNVTAFTSSEFGRSLESNGSGSDHGWGGHQIVMGGAVHGGSIYGHYPDLANGCPLDVGGGCFVPTTSMDEYLAEMVLWLGTPVSDLPYVLPDLSKFWSARSRIPPLGMLS